MSDDQGRLFQQRLNEHRATWVPVENHTRMTIAGRPDCELDLTAPTEPNPATPAEAEGTDFIEEKGRREGAATAILRALKRGPCTNRELAEIGGLRFGARILDLRNAGYDIETERSGNIFIYRLKA